MTVRKIGVEEELMLVDPATGELVHPETLDLAPVREVLEALVAYVGSSLDEAGDRDFVLDAFEHLLSRGNGASRQRSVYEATGGDLRAVVNDLRERTAASVSE